MEDTGKSQYRGLIESYSMCSICSEDDPALRASPESQFATIAVLSPANPSPVSDRS